MNFVLVWLVMGVLTLLVALLVYRTRKLAHDLGQLRVKLEMLDVRVGVIAGKVESPSAKVVDTKKMFL